MPDNETPAGGHAEGVVLHSGAVREAATVPPAGSPSAHTPAAENDYTITAQTEDYEVGVRGDRIIAACRCGEGMDVPNKGLGRATVAAWRTRHQHVSPPGLPESEG